MGRGYAGQRRAKSRGLVLREKSAFKIREKIRAKQASRARRRLHHLRSLYLLKMQDAVEI